MDKYPTTITDDVLKELSHISDAEIERDIKDTQSEISSLITEANGLRLIQESKMGTPEAKMAYSLQSEKEFGMAKRVRFVVFLQNLLATRKQCQTDQPL